MKPTTPEVAAAMETHAVAASGSRELAASTAAATPSRRNINVEAFVILILSHWGICCILNLYFLADQLGW